MDVVKKINKTSACGLCCIKVKNLGVRFGSVTVLENVNLHIHCGTITEIIGKNGSGKSTFVKALLGEVKHTGDIEYRNTEAGSKKHLKIGYVPQKLDIDESTPMSVYDLFVSFSFKMPVLFKSKKVYAKIKEALSEFEAEDLIDKPIGTLSGGQLQRVLISMAVMDKPKLLILDEPVSGVDSSGMKVFYDKMTYLKEHYDMAILIVSHDLEYVYHYADNVMLLDNTVLAYGSPRDVYNSKAFEDTFGGFKPEEAVSSIDKKERDAMLCKKSEQSNAISEQPYDPSYKGGKR